MNIERVMGIEEKIEQIESSATRNYFREVYSCYTNGNYRAAVVSLWSVLVCDAVYKTQKLFELTGDGWARKKIAEIERLQQENSKSSEWELDLFEGFYNNKKFIGIGEISNIRDIQKKRHLCAHPVLSEDSALYTPSKDAVKSMILNALDDFLIRKNYYGKDVFPLLIETLKDNSEYYSELKNIKPFIVKYCQRLTLPAIYQIFKDFYKFSFRLDNEDATKYRRLNRRACHDLYQEVKKYPFYVQKMKEEREYFENVSFKTSILIYFFTFLSYNKEIYETFSEEMRDRLKVSHTKETDDDFFYSLKVASNFLYQNPSDYFSVMKQLLTDDTIKRFTLAEYNYINEVYHDVNCIEIINDLSIIFAENSPSYDDADERFNLVLDEGVLRSYTAKQLERLIASFNQSSQVRNRRRGDIDLAKLKHRLAEVTD